MQYCPLRSLQTRDENDIMQRTLLAGWRATVQPHCNSTVVRGRTSTHVDHGQAHLPRYGKWWDVRSAMLIRARRRSGTSTVIDSQCGHLSSLAVAARCHSTNALASTSLDGVASLGLSPRVAVQPNWATRFRVFIKQTFGELTGRHMVK